MQKMLQMQFERVKIINKKFIQWVYKPYTDINKS